MQGERWDNMALSKKEKVLIGRRIKEIRLEKGMTTKEFGKLFGATDSNVTSWEKGRTSPTPERLKAIAKIGDTTVEELLNWSNNDVIIDTIEAYETLLDNAFNNFQFQENYLIFSNKEVKNNLMNTELGNVSYEDVLKAINIAILKQLSEKPTNYKELYDALICRYTQEINMFNEFSEKIPIEDDYGMQIHLFFQKLNKNLGILADKEKWDNNQ